MLFDFFLEVEKTFYLLHLPTYNTKIVIDNHTKMLISNH